ncbi:MAG: hypothetical protein IPH78_06345 [Bacteroidetes bacterium]|nr:hypothetical protein [Bacteroidota bacterium]MBK8657391.1 hypothetical protein [Bacteroidota bacterium]
MENFLKSVIVFFGSIIKFSMGTFTAMEAELGIGGSLANIMGGILGIVLFTYLGSFIQDYMVRTYPNKFGKKFTRSNRFLIKVKQRFGLGGIAALTPILLSIPVGVFFALALTHDKKKILVSMIMSMLFWATVIALPYYLFDISIIQMIANLFEK